MNLTALGNTDEERVNNLVQAMDGYFANGAHHLNVNVFGVEKLLDCQAHPEKPEYANFTIRVSGYAPGDSGSPAGRPSGRAPVALP